LSNTSIASGETAQQRIDALWCRAVHFDLELEEAIVGDDAVRLRVHEVEGAEEHVAVLRRGEVSHQELSVAREEGVGGL
jgi:hypothetical protein